MSVPGLRLLGASVPRIEDARVLTGRGRYIDDLHLPGCLHAVFVRSDMPHAAIASLDADRARQMPGVVAVITGAELAAETVALSSPVPLQNYVARSWHPLATGTVRHVGDPVALVVAESRPEAEDGRDAVEVEYDPLDPIVSREEAQDEGRGAIYEELGGNVSYSDSSEYGDPAEAFAAADRVVRVSVRWPRVCHVPMECRGGLANYDPGTGELTYDAPTQAPHLVRAWLAQALRHPADRLQVRAPDFGGSFGQKGAMHREDVPVCFASKRLGRPVKWIEDRVENLASATQGRGEALELAAAVRDDGTILAVDASVVFDEGAYPFAWPAPMFTALIRNLLPGPYRIDHMRWDETIVVTNKPTWGPYRAPWAIETLARELLIDRIAGELELDPVDVRRRNLVPIAEQPRMMATGQTLQGATSLDSLERAVEAVGYRAFRDEQRRAGEEGRLLGIGFTTFIEGAPGPPDMPDALGWPPMPERAVAQIEPDGQLTVMTSQSPHGQGHETTLAQVAATEFGVPLQQVRVVWGDTRITPFSTLGTAGSRAAAYATGAVLHATRTVKEKVLDAAADMLEIAPKDLAIVDGVVTPHGAPDRGIPVAEVATRTYFIAAPEGEEPSLRSDVLYRWKGRGGWSGGTHACVVEVDRDTGKVAIRRYVVVEDCGRMINPAIVEGQIRGGIAQGIGLALLEDAHYDEFGNLVAGTMIDYLLPTAMEVPAIEIIHLESEPLDDLDYRGVGEGGTLAAPVAVANAVSDALGGAAITELPLTPERVLDLLDEAGRATAATTMAEG